MSLTHNNSPTFMTLQEAAASGIAAYSTLRSYVADGRLPAVRIAGKIRVRPEDLAVLATPINTRSFEDVEAGVAHLLEAAPPLSNAQVRRLVSLVGGAE